MSWTILLRGGGEWVVLNPGYSATAKMVSVWAMNGESGDCPEAGENANPQPVWSGFAFENGLYVPTDAESELTGCSPGFEGFSNPELYEGKYV
jgi:hypothetical protein